MLCWQPQQPQRGYTTIRKNLGPWAIDFLLALGSLLFLYSFAGAFLFAGPKPNVSCLAENHIISMSEKQPDGSYKERDADDWYVTCQITLDKKVIYAPRTLPLAHPTSFRDAMDAIDEWRMKKAPQILKELKSKEKT